MNQLQFVRDYCIGTAESEKAIVNDIFFDSGTYFNLLRIPPGSPIILAGKKGTGKSVIINFIKNKADDAKILNVFLKPDNLENIDTADSFLDIANLKRVYFESLISTISIKIGESLKVYLNRKEKKLFEKALIVGARDKNILSIGTRYLAKAGSEFSDIDFTKLLPTEKTEIKIEELKRCLNYTLKKKTFWLFIDDIDQIAQLNNREQLNRVWALLLACRQVCENYQNIKCIITLRTEIWELLKKDKYGQRDQVDHFKSLIRELDPNDDLINDVLLKRLRFIESKIGLKKTTKEFSPLFEGNDLNLPDSEEERYWNDFIVKNSRKRPRDAIQLVDILAKHSILNSQSKITSSIVKNALYEYSKDRVDDLSREFATDCDNVSALIKTFIKTKFRMNSDELSEHIKQIPSVFSLSIRGSIVHPGNNEDLILLWSFLHELGFLNPCVPDSSKKKGYRHIEYKENPDFVSATNLNEMRASVWEVHPAYRSFLIKEIENEKRKSGIGLKEFFKSKKTTIISLIINFT
jgi:hypothetical protein